jgi:hypothetical protein
MDDEMTEQIAEGRKREQLEMFPDIPSVFFGPTTDQIERMKAAAQSERDQMYRLVSSGIEPELSGTPSIGVVTFEEVAQDIYDECFDLLVERQKRYGSRNIDQQGLYGVLVRMRDDKLSRIQRSFNGEVRHGEIVLNDIDMSGEEGDTLEDAYKDLANYAVISLLLLRGLWGKPLEDDVVAK